MTDINADVENGCGYSYDHDLRLIDTRDGISSYECRECGAEIVDPPDHDEDTP